MPQRWGIWFAVEGDLRFLSHHETMRVIERAAVRAGLALRYSQGFNPRPILSFAFARPVGVATKSDLFVLSLEDPGWQEEGSDSDGAGPSAEVLLGKLNAQAPTGMRFLRSVALRAKGTPRPDRCRYELALHVDQVEQVDRRIGNIQHEASLPVVREVPARSARRRKAQRKQIIDLKGLLEDLRVDGRVLRWTARSRGNLWPRCGEVLRLLELAEAVNLARVVRTEVDYLGIPAAGGDCPLPDDPPAWPENPEGRK